MKPSGNQAASPGTSAPKHRRRNGTLYAILIDCRCHLSFSQFLPGVIILVIIVARYDFVC
jgi:hypothetical protein